MALREMAWRRSALWHMTMARLREWLREPAALFWSFGFPVVLTIALGVAFRNRPPEAVPVIVEDGPAAAQVQSSLAKSKDLQVRIAPPDEARRQLRAGGVALVVQPGPPLTTAFDPTRPESRLAHLLVDDALQRAAGRRDVATIDNQPVTEPGARYVDFLVPGLIGMNLMQAGMWGVGYAIVELRSKKLLRRLVATPMRKSDFLLSFLITRLIFLALELPIVLGAAVLLFGVTVQGSLLAFVAVAAVGSACFAGLGLLVASRARNTQTAGGLMNLVTMPMMIGSGVFFSIRTFPPVVQQVLALLPLTALNDALRAIQNEGAGLAAVMPQLVVLTVIGAVSMAAALKWFRWV